MIQGQEFGYHVGIRINEREIIGTFFRELEVRVQAADKVRFVFARSEYEQITICHHGFAGRETPFGFLRGIVGEKPSADVDVKAAQVAKLDPVGTVTVFIVDRVMIVRHVLVEDHARVRQVRV